MKMNQWMAKQLLLLLPFLAAVTVSGSLIEERVSVELLPSHSVSHSFISNSSVNNDSLTLPSAVDTTFSSISSSSTTVIHPSTSSSSSSSSPFVQCESSSLFATSSSTSFSSKSLTSSTLHAVLHWIIRQLPVVHARSMAVLLAAITPPTSSSSSSSASSSLSRQSSPLYTSSLNDRDNETQQNDATATATATASITQAPQTSVSASSFLHLPDDTTQSLHQLLLFLFACTAVLLSLVAILLLRMMLRCHSCATSSSTIPSSTHPHHRQQQSPSPHADDKATSSATPSSTTPSSVTSSSSSTPPSSPSRRMWCGRINRSSSPQLTSKPHLNVIRHRVQPVYLSHFNTFQPPESWRISLAAFERIHESFEVNPRSPFSPASSKFIINMLTRSGLSMSDTHFPPGILRTPDMDLSRRAAQEEVETVIFGVVSGLLEEAQLAATDIDILVVNCSLYVPTPSLASMIINKYGMRKDIQSFNLGGMGCSAGLISVSLASDLLQVYPHANALIVSTEAITPNMYQGNDRSMLLQNALFRCGGAAILLTNYKPNNLLRRVAAPQHHTNHATTTSSTATTTSTTNEQRSGSCSFSSSSLSNYERVPLYELEHVIRCHVGGGSEAAYRCVEQTNDEEGKVGVRLSKDLVKVAGQALTENMKVLGPLVLPYSEQLKYFINRLLFIKPRHKSSSSSPSQSSSSSSPSSASPSPSSSTTPLSSSPSPSTNTPASSSTTTNDASSSSSSSSSSASSSSLSSWMSRSSSYQPRWEKAIQHWCVHAGGRAVLDAVQSGLGLSERALAPSRWSLYHYGNTSSSSIWYEMAYLHQQPPSSSSSSSCSVKVGDRVIQVGFGSGFKCNSAVWKRIA